MFEDVKLSVEERNQVEALFQEFDAGLHPALESLFKGLNREQVAALAHPHSEGKPLLIVAGAGSGKTSVLTRRVSLLFLAGIPAEKIFVSTFTVKAAGEMKERVGKLIQTLNQTATPALKPKLDEILRSFNRSWIGTFHSLCLRLLKELGPDGFSPFEEFGFPPTVQIFSDADSKKMLKEILAEMPVQPDVRDAAAAIDLAANELLTPDSLAAKKTYANMDADLLADVWNKYMEGKKSKGVVDFTDLLYLAATAFADRRRCAESWRSRFTHVLIDEYQDTNIAQYAIATELAAANKNMFVVGDDDQSIYRFRGADVRNIRAFTQDYPEARVVRLIRNYRSTPVILGAANAVLADRPETSTDKTLLASAADSGKPPEKIIVYEASDETDEMNFMIFQIREMLAEGYTYKDIVIFYRVHEFAEKVTGALKAENFPYMEVGGHAVVEHSLLKTFQCLISATHLLRIRAEGKFDLIIHALLLRDALRDIWTLGKLGPKNREDRAMLLGLPAPEKILLDEQGYVEAVHRCQSGLTQQHMEQLWSGIHGAAQGVDSLTPHEIVGLFIEVFGLVGAADEDPEIRQGLKLIQKLLKSRLPFSSPGRMGLDQLLAAFGASAQGEPAEDLADDNVIRLLTVHASKGLEFPAVIVIGVEEGILPFVHPGEASSESESERIEREEEELRLFYVAITRAKQRLVLSCAARREWYGKGVSNRPSRFLARLPKELITRGSALAGMDKVATRTKQFFKDLLGA